MSTPEIDERFDHLVRELRTLPGAPDELRARVLGLSETAPEPAPRWGGMRRPQLRRLVAVGAPLMLVALAVVVGVYGIVTSGGSSTKSAANRRERATPTLTSVTSGGGGSASAGLSVAPPPPPSSAHAKAKRSAGTFLNPAAPSPTATTSDQAGAAAGAAKLPPTQGRLQQYTASMTLRVQGVDGLSRTTARAMRITRSLGGFVASVDYGTPNRKSGESYLTVRIPNARVQQAVVRFSSLGVILSQQISIRDLQTQANHQAVEIIRLQREIDRLAGKLRGSLSPEERVRTQSQLDAARAALRARTEQHAGTVSLGRLATFRLEFTTRKTAGVPVHHRRHGRIGRATGHAFGLLSKLVAGGIYALIILSPLLVLGMLALVASRLLRRRGAERLLARA
jgi:hypothetical protein